MGMVEGIPMTATRPCPACGNPLPADAPGGLCPRCLLAGGLDTAASPSTDFDPPTIAELTPLFPQLEIIEPLGAGGMGAVYKARQTNLDRLVALKVLPPRDDPSFAERFTREARTLAKLNHPGIVQVYDFGRAGTHYYIVMEYVEGVNLRQAGRSGQMTPAEALAVVPQICAALQFAHENGVVHRDIKPENILLDRNGQVKIADFGLAKLLGATGPVRLTGTHQAMGTLHYMAPEQWEKPATVDHRADIYSLGVVFYELLTGELPLGRFAPPSEKVHVDVRLDQVVLRALAKEPERRYQRAGDVKTDLERIRTAAARRPPAQPPTVAAVSSAVRPRFAYHVLLPVLGLAVVAFVALAIAEDDLNPENPLSAAAKAVFIILTCIGPIVVVVLFVRWLWLSLRSRNPTAFWLIAAPLMLVTVFAYTCLSGIVWYESAGSPPRVYHTLTLNDRLIGTWATAFGDAKFEFKSDGTFVYWVHEADAQLSKDNKVRLDETEKRVTGRYGWADADTIEFQSPIRLQFVTERSVRTREGDKLRFKVVSDGNEFVLMQDNGEVLTRLRQVP
jgi:predicted Ser/Thr protein kinase